MAKGYLLLVLRKKSEKTEGHTKLDFSPPPIDIMSFIESPTPREHYQTQLLVVQKG